MKLKLLIVALLIFGCITCSKDSFNTKPELKFLSVNATVIPQPSVLEFHLQCTDKEGDVIDTIWIQRVSKVAGCESLSGIDSFAIPNFDPPKNVKAEFVFTYNYPNSQPPPNIGGCTIGNGESTTDTSYFRFWMRDQAKHYSDTVQSPDIALLKQ